MSSPHTPNKSSSASSSSSIAGSRSNSSTSDSASSGASSSPAMKLRGAVYCVLWYLSILFGFYILYAPLLPLLILHRKLYRKITDKMFTIWESFNVVCKSLIVKAGIFFMRRHLFRVFLTSFWVCVCP